MLPRSSVPQEDHDGTEVQAGHGWSDQPPGELTTSIGLGVRGVGQMARATATCPSRDLADGQWSASPGCITEAQDIADGMPQVNRSELTEHESTTLTGIRFKNDPPSITE